MLRDGTALAAILDDSGPFVFRSTNGGASWSKPGVRIRGSHDHEMLVADAADNVYFVAGGAARDAGGAPRSAVIVERSTDGGRTFTPRGRGIFSTLTYEAETPVLLSDGTLVVSFMDHHDRSRRLLERRRQWLALSRDSGMTFLPPSLVSEDCNRLPPAAWPTFARGSAPSAGAPEPLYFLCEAHEASGILFATSVDRGERWTATRRIDGGALERGWTKTPTMTVDGTGAIVVTWQDRRDDPKRLCQRLHAVASIDGGYTFSPASPVSTSVSCPDTPVNGSGLAARFPSGGEYSGLVALGRGEFFAVWSDSRTGRYELRGARIRVM
ncbi:MAG: sialidase family protein [Gemmatimonadaceae bacterium]